MLGISLKALNIILMCFWKIQPSEKNTRESTAIVVTKNVERIKN